MNDNDYVWAVAVNDDGLQYVAELEDGVDGAVLTLGQCQDCGGCGWKVEVAGHGHVATCVGDDLVDGCGARYSIRRGLARNVMGCPLRPLR